MKILWHLGGSELVGIKLDSTINDQEARDTYISYVDKRVFTFLHVHPKSLEVERVLDQGFPLFVAGRSFTLASLGRTCAR